MKVNADTGALMVEMEVAALFIVGTMRGVRTAAIATADGNVFNQGDYDPHGTIVAEGKKKMMRVGLNVAKQASLEDNEEEVQIFDQQSQMKYLEIFKSSNLYDFAMNHSDLSDKQRAIIMNLAQKGSFASFQFFLEKGTTLNEQEIKDATILFHKIQRGADDTFSVKSKVFFDTLQK